MSGNAGCSQSLAIILSLICAVRSIHQFAWFSQALIYEVPRSHASIGDHVRDAVSGIATL
jgi:hypothetical protein